LIGAPILVAVTIGVAPIIGRSLGSLSAVLALGAVYWSGCWFLALFAGKRGALVALYRESFNRRPLEQSMTWLPVVVTFFVGFLPSVSRLPLSALAAVFGVSLINGVTEELLWRGAFASTFSTRLLLGYVYPVALFAAWHIALALVPGMHYEGGPLALIGGSAVFGLLWGWTVWRTHDLRSATIAHVLTNTFAFSALALANWIG
jgi:hypothetical protein